MSPLPSIRRGRATDLPAVLALLESARLPTADIASVDELPMWVLKEWGAIVGVIALQRFGAEALLRSLAVTPEYRKRGFGAQLVARLEERARADNIQELVLLTETAETFFGTLDYSVIDRCHVSDRLKESTEFRTLCPASATCMSKTLATPS